MESKAPYLVLVRTRYKYTVGLWRTMSAYTTMIDAQAVAKVINDYFLDGKTATEAKVVHESQYAPFSEKREGVNDE